MQQGQARLERVPSHKVLNDGVSLLDMLEPDGVCLKAGILDQLRPVRPAEQPDDNHLRQSEERKADTVLPSQTSDRTVSDARLQELSQHSSQSSKASLPTNSAILLLARLTAAAWSNSIFGSSCVRTIMPPR